MAPPGFTGYCWVLTDFIVFFSILRGLLGKKRQDGSSRGEQVFFGQPALRGFDGRGRSLLGLSEFPSISIFFILCEKIRSCSN